MGRRLAMLLATGALALTAGPTLGHHSFAMFDRDNQIDLEGVVNGPRNLLTLGRAILPTWRVRRSAV